MENLLFLGVQILKHIRVFLLKNCEVFLHINAGIVKKSVELNQEISMAEVTEVKEL